MSLQGTKSEIPRVKQPWHMWASISGFNSLSLRVVGIITASLLCGLLCPIAFPYKDRAVWIYVRFEHNTSSWSGFYLWASEFTTDNVDYVYYIAAPLSFGHYTIINLLNFVFWNRSFFAFRGYSTQQKYVKRIVCLLFMITCFMKVISSD